MLGLIQIDDHVAWTDECGSNHQGVIVTLADDGLYAEVRELGQDDITELPTWHLHPID